jgi:hypothetical protein
MLIQCIRSLATLGAILTIVSLAIGPFAQQAVKTVLCDNIVAGGVSRIPIAQKIPIRDSFRFGAGAFEVEVDTKNAVLGGITSPNTTASTAAISFECSTGNCTFPSYGGVTYSSLGLCNACEDVTSMIQEKDANYTIHPEQNLSMRNYTLSLSPKGPNVSVSPDIIQQQGNWVNVNSDYLYPPMDNILTAAIISFTSVGCSNGVCPANPNWPSLDRGMNIIGVKCSLRPCMKNYYGEIRNGALSEKVISTVTPAYEPIGNIPQVNLTAVKLPCIIDNQIYDMKNLSLVPKSYARENITWQNTTSMVPRQCLYKYEFSWLFGLAKAVSDVTYGNCLYQKGQGDSVWCTGLDNLHKQERFSWWTAKFYNNNTATLETIREQFDNIADAVTNRVRSIGLTADTDIRRLETSQRAYVTGAVHQTSICTQFEWRWLVLPTMLAIVTTLLLLAVIFETHRHQLSRPGWKSSSLPFLFYGFKEGGLDVRLDHQIPLSELEGRAEQTIVRYAVDGHGCSGFVLEPHKASRY